jgi:hypothetical protein
MNAVAPLHRRPRVPLRDALGLVLRELRRAPALRDLGRREWAVFVAVACHWQGHDEAWPSQQTIAAFAGYTARVVPEAVATLEQRELLLVRRLVGADGMRRMVYAPGAALLRALAAFAARYPRAVESPPAIAAGVPEIPADLPELAAGRPEIPVPIDGKPVPLNQERRRTNLLLGEAADETREIAIVVLAEHFRRRHPTMAPVRTFDAEDVDAVARCAGAVTGERDTKLQVLLDAIEGAFAASPQPPTVRFVWSRIEHFFVHADRGRRARLRRERAAAEQASSRQPNDRENDGAPSAAIPPAQLEADLARLFGPGWRSAR